MKQKLNRKFLVDGTYQFTQAGAVILANVLVVVLVAALLSWYYLIAGDGSMVVNHNKQIPIYIMACILVVTLFSLIFSMVRSRATAGMMTILHKVLTEAGQGRFPEREIAFRKSDYAGFRRLAPPLNACLDRMRNSKDPKTLAGQVEALMAKLDETQMDGARIRLELKNLIRDLEAK